MNTSPVHTPDANMNLFTNIWGKYQCVNIARWRSASHFRPGEGGYGYRDTAQDIEGLLSIDLNLAHKKLMKILYYQYNDGHAVSGFSDIEGPWENTGIKESVVGKSDVALWLPFEIVGYVKESGDFNFLNEEVEFFNGGKATVYEHALRAVEYSYTHRGKKGFPLIGRADWNDAFDACGKHGKGESVWLGMALCRSIKQLIELAHFINDEQTENQLQKKYDELKHIINTYGWDGEWYLRLFTDSGHVIGSTSCEEGKIFLNPQSWAILSEVADEVQAEIIMKNVDKYLETEVGPAMFAPAYTKYNPEIGRISAFAPGTKENAAVFSHVSAFKILADCMRGCGNRAFETFSKTLPTNPVKVKNPDRYKVEPFVYAEYCIGPENPYHFGEGAFTWQTGTTPWMLQIATEWILGARKDFGGLLIDPCIPSTWKKCKIVRHFRGSVYRIEISNPKGVENGVATISVDGNEIDGTLIKPHSDGKEHLVKVTMG
ncbi:hypothetical protein HQ585_09615 [candidate division KSB1 bacterium]|nr:hypothetical protein [candidate division KSB1 bacterium]